MKLNENLTKAPKEKMDMMLEKGYITLDKDPYNGVTVINGIVNDKDLQKRIEAVVLLEPLLNAKVGIGSNLLQQLIDFGYNTMDSLENFEKDSRIIKSKVLYKSLLKYFDGAIRTVPRMSRSEAKEFKEILDKTCS